MFTHSDDLDFCAVVLNYSFTIHALQFPVNRSRSPFLFYFTEREKRRVVVYFSNQQLPQEHLNQTILASA